MQQLTPRPIVPPSRNPIDSRSKQTRRLALALVLLLIALVAVILRDHDFWFGNDNSSAESEVATPAAAPQTVAKSVPVARPVKSLPAKSSTKPVSVAKTTEATGSPDSGIVASHRTVLPPLDVEVIAGSSHRNLHPGSKVTNLRITEDGSTLPLGTPTFAGATEAADRERLSTGTGVYEASYPLLAQHMNVQGSVVLQALIGADGVIENLRILSGPAILASAAQQAVREWRFRPIYQHGQAVESKATITVNFTIKVNENAPKTSLAESRTEPLDTLTR